MEGPEEYVRGSTEDSTKPYTKFGSDVPEKLRKFAANYDVNAAEEKAANETFRHGQPPRAANASVSSKEGVQIPKGMAEPNLASVHSAKIVEPSPVPATPAPAKMQAGATMGQQLYGLAPKMMQMVVKAVNTLGCVTSIFSAYRAGIDWDKYGAVEVGPGQVFVTDKFKYIREHPYLTQDQMHKLMGGI